MWRQVIPLIALGLFLLNPVNSAPASSAKKPTTDPLILARSDSSRTIHVATAAVSDWSREPARSVSIEPLIQEFGDRPGRSALNTRLFGYDSIGLGPYPRDRLTAKINIVGIPGVRVILGQQQAAQSMKISIGP